MTPLGQPKIDPKIDRISDLVFDPFLLRFGLPFSSLLDPFSLSDRSWTPFAIKNVIFAPVLRFPIRKRFFRFHDVTETGKKSA